MRTAFSADGTVIAFDQFGDGPPVIMAAGAFNTRAATEPLARALQGQFSVLNYDRRGRGDSGDTAPYAVDCEIEDLGVLITAAGGSASVFGYSSGATLALRAAAAGLASTHLVLYEPPFRPGLEAIAHTLAYDAAVTGDMSLPARLLASVTAPALVICGEQSPPMLQAAARAVAETMPNGRLCELAGQTHDISPEAAAPVIADFLTSEPPA